MVSQEHPGLEEVVTGKHGTDAGGKPRPGVFSVPVNAVDKMSPDRSVAAAIRVVTDLRGPNATGDLRNHPPALAPRHREVGRSCLWWRRRCPGIPIYLIKLDVDAAFKKVYLWVPDMGRSAFNLPEPREGEVPKDLEQALEWERRKEETAAAKQDAASPWWRTR